MFKSLAHVALFATLATAAMAQSANPATTATVNHISDSERDRLMQEAMEKARLELEKVKAEREAAEKIKAERDAAERRSEAAAAAAKKAEEERLARELTEAESKTDKSNELPPIDLDAVKPATADKAKPEPRKTETAAPKKSETPKKTETASSKPAESPKKTETASTSKKEDTPKTADKKPAESEDTPKKTVIETVSTREPGAPLSVKTSMPVGDEQRKAEQEAARRSADAGAPPRSGSSSSSSISGQVVGLMRSSDGKPKILLQSEDARMIQVVLNTDDVPAPGAIVSIRGRAIGGSEHSPVISATSVSIKSGQKVEPLRDFAAEPAAAVPVPPMIHADPMIPPPMPMMGPPMPLGMGPMIGPPGFGGPPPF